MSRVVEIWVKYELLDENGKVLEEGQVTSDPDAFVGDLETELEEKIEEIEEDEE